MPAGPDQASALRAAAALRDGTEAGKTDGDNMQNPVTPEEQPADSGAERAKSIPFNFNQPPRHNKTQLRSLKLLHTNFCQPLAKTLAALSGLPCQVKLESLTPQKLTGSDTSVYLSATAGGGRFLLAFSRTSAWLLLDRLLGGSGNGEAAPNRPHSGIEKNILSRLLAGPVLARYSEIWGRITPVTFSIEEFVDDVYSVPGLSAATETVTAVFSLKLDAAEGELAVILPFSFLKPLMPELDMAKLLNSEQATGKTAGDKALLGIAVNLRVFLGRIEIKVKDLNSLTHGDVLRLDTRPEDEVTIEIEGQPRFAGTTGKIGNGLGVQIVRPIKQEKINDGGKNASNK
jgi:flagellar motor switch protein FliM